MQKDNITSNIVASSPPSNDTSTNFPQYSLSLSKLLIMTNCPSCDDSITYRQAKQFW